MHISICLPNCRKTMFRYDLGHIGMSTNNSVFSSATHALQKLPITDKLEITNPIIGVFLRVNHKCRFLTSVHFNKCCTVSFKNICQTFLFLWRIGPLKPGAHEVLEFIKWKRLFILLMNVTVSATGFLIS